MNGDVLPIEIMARKEDWQEGISLYCRQVTVGNGFVIAKPIEFEKYEEGNYAQPFTRLGIQSAQQLIDELWNCGLRPSEGTGSAGALAATERHLGDMQKIVFHKLGIKE